MPIPIRIALAQINPTVGAIGANIALAGSYIDDARSAGADLVVLPELCIPGYPAEDLYLKRHFLEANAQAVAELARGVAGIAVLVGFSEPAPASAVAGSADSPAPRRAHNSLAFIRDGKVEVIYRKQRLPNYAVFDEERYFQAGAEAVVVEVAGVKVGLTICEDVWEPGPPANDCVELGAQLIVCPSGSPFFRGKREARERMFAERAAETGVPLAFCNLVGGQDELVFDGGSFIVDPGGNVLARASQFKEELLVADLAASEPPQLDDPFPDTKEVYYALMMGLRDYVAKNSFERVLIGVSGGIDSALVALLAADALGPERVTGVVMPSPHSSVETQSDACQIVTNIGAELHRVRIADVMAAYSDALRAPMGGEPEGVAAENLQARIRGNILMALSNANGWLVLTTGNKSEMSVGYATLYGDMAGGFAVIKDVPKTLVYELVRDRNALADGGLIPASVIERAPSAELRPDQRDDDSLPPYEVLDQILAAYVERDCSREEIVALGHDERVVTDVLRMVDLAEYKRRQAPPGVRITAKAFGRDRRLPITNRYTG